MPDASHEAVDREVLKMLTKQQGSYEVNQGMTTFIYTSNYQIC